MTRRLIDIAFTRLALSIPLRLAIDTVGRKRQHLEAVNRDVLATSLANSIAAFLDPTQSGGYSLQPIFGTFD
jgi:hypothetical protein